MSRHTTAELAANAQRCAEFLASLSEDCPTPTHVHPAYGKQGEVQWLLFVDDEPTLQKQVAQSVIRAVGGQWDKEPGDLFGFVQTLPSGLRVEVVVSRPAVCDRIVTGTRLAKAMVPALDAPMVEVIETVEDVEWRCHPLLAESVSS